MADTKISAATDAGTLLATDKFPLARSGSSTAFAATVAELMSYVDGALPVASTSLAGVVKVDGSTITITGGVISAASGGGYTLPTASTSVLGGVKIDGSSVTISSGVLSSAVPSVAGRTGAITLSHGDITDWSTATAGFTYTLPTASTTTLGGVKVDGSTITIASGVISAAAGGYTLPTASTSVLGGVKIDGTTVTISSGVISAVQPAPSSTTPAADGTAAVGSSATYARADHVHPTDTSRAPLASPTFTGTPAAPTASGGTNTTQIATCAFVTAAVSSVSYTLPTATASVLGGVKPDGTSITNTSGAISVTYGTAANTAAQGNDSRITGALSATTAASTYAPLASPALTGTPTVPTASAGTSTTQAASTAFVGAAITAAAYVLPTASTSVLGGVKVDGTTVTISSGVISAVQPAASSTTPAMDGTAAVGTSAAYARADHVHPSDTSRAPLASPALTGTPTTPTAAVGTNTTQIASTAYVYTAVAGAASIATTGGTTTLTAAQYGSPVIIITGTLTSNATLYFPNTGVWTISNRTTGSFAVTVKPSVGVGVTIAQGYSQEVFGDGSSGLYVSSTDFQTPPPIGTGAPAAGAFSTLSATGSVSGSGFTNLLAPYAPINGPTFTGTPTAPTAAAGTNTTQLATTAYVIGQAATATPQMDGTAAVGTTTSFARADHVHPSDTSRAPLASPAFTGTPTVPTASAGTNTTQAASTAFVLGQASAVAPVSDSIATVGVATTFARADHAHPAVPNIGKNKIHNALFNIAQRGAGAFTASGFTADRWFAGFSSDTDSISLVALTDTDRSQIGDEEAVTGLQNTFTGSSSAGAFSQLYQSMENVRRLSNKTVTVSFFAKCASGTLKLGVNINQNFGSGGSPSAYVSLNGQAASLTTTWQRFSFSFTMPSTAGKTFGSNNDSSTQLDFWFSSGTTYATIAGNPGVQSGTVTLWGVQVEIGSVATPLEKVDLRYDFANCQRFYQSVSVTSFGYGLAGAAVECSTLLQVPMRAAPTLTPTWTTLANAGGNSASATSSTITVGATPSSTAGYGIVVSILASADL